MGQRSAIPIRWAIWVPIWGIAFAALAVGLPARPAYRITGYGQPHPKRFLDEETLLISHTDPVISPGPHSVPLFHLLDLPTGMVRSVEFPPLIKNADDLDERQSSEPGMIWQSKQIRGWEVFGHFLVVRFRVADRLWVGVWNWRTGKETWRRLVPLRRASGVIGRWVWMQEDPRSQSQATDLFDIATGEPAENSLPDGLPAMRLAAPGIWDVSPDGRFLIDYGGFPARLWSLDAKEGSRPPAPVELPGTVAAAFSSDSRYVAALSVWRPFGTGFRRVWRVFELPTARQLAEHEQTRGVADVTQPGFRFLEGGRHVVASDDDVYPGRSALELPGSDFIYCWNWQANEMRTLTGSASLRPLDAEFTGKSKFVIDDQQIIDISTGQPVARSVPPREVQAISSSSRWALVREAPADLLLWIAGVVARWSKPLGEFLTPSPRLRLQDLSTGWSVASLDPQRIPRFSPDSRWLVSTRDDALEVWPLPVPLPWGRAALWLLGVWLIPLSARLLRRRKTPA